MASPAKTEVQKEVKTEVKKEAEVKKQEEEDKGKAGLCIRIDEIDEIVKEAVALQDDDVEKRN